jgi:hypothetical protein
MTRVSFYDNHDIFDLRHRAHGGFERCLQRHIQHAETDLLNFHYVFIIVWLGINYSKEVDGLVQQTFSVKTDM